MEYTSKILEEAINAIATLPSIGKKSALRLVLHLVSDDTGKTDKIAAALHAVKTQLKECKYCFNFSDTDTCTICGNPVRARETICVVENVRDLMAIEETGQYKGLYHILGGVISPIDGIGPAELHIEALIARIDEGLCQEVIMAISPTIEGDTTIYYITKLLSSKGVTVSTIARGVSFGGELEYADELTLGRSIVSRTPYSIQQ